MKSQIIYFVFIIFVSSPIVAIDIDFSVGGYKVKSEEINDNVKYERRTSIEIEAEQQKNKQKEEREKIFQEQPWRKIAFKTDEIVNSDYVNTSSNTVVITVPDWEKAKKDNIDDDRIIMKNYRLNLMLFPGDKYHATKDGKNGIKMSNYLSAYKRRDELLERYSKETRFKKDNDRDGLSYYEEVNVTNINLKLEEGDKHIFVSTDYRKRDSDYDGLSDFDEIRGTHGFVTDPIDPDTDNDGIPDGADKSPLAKCKSNDPNKMPPEWIEYVAGEDNEKARLLIASKGDPDGDGLTNEQEKMFSTDPFTPDKEEVIYFPQKPLLRYDGNGAYIGKINIYLNRKEAAICELHTSYDGTGTPENMDDFEIKHVSSVPVGWKPSPLKKLFNRNRFKTKSLYAVIQPKTIHSFLLIYKGDDNLNMFGGEDVIITIREPGANPDHPEYPKSPFFHKYVKISHNKPDFRWKDISYFPPSPKLLYPTNDYIFSCVTNQIYRSEPLPQKYIEKGWYSILRVCPSFNLTPKTDPNKIKNPWTENPRALPEDKNEYNKQRDKYERNAYLWFYEIWDPKFREPVVYTDIRVMFKEDRISEDHPLVFKGDTEEEILEEIEKRYKGTLIR